MRIRARVLTVIAVTLALGMFCFNSSFAQDQKDPHGGKGGAGDQVKMPAPGTPEAAKMQKEMEEKMMAAGMPGPEHKEMMKSAGEWDAEMKFLDFATGQWTPPAKGTAKFEPLFDGRYMKMTFKGSMKMGDQDMPFEGMGIMGYDNIKKKYFSTWIDSMSTMFMKSEGTKQGNVTTFIGSMPDPASGQEMKSREVVTHVDDTHMKFEMFCTMGAAAPEMKMMEINYTKK